MPLVEALHSYYAKHGILSTSFACSFKSQCQGDCQTFTGPKSAFVSTGYEQGALPKILFISLDSGSGNPVNEHRLPLSVRQFNEFDLDFTALAEHKHWYRTHELAWYLLRRFDSALTVEDTRHYFAHTNSAKCCMNNPQRRMANAILFQNCEGYIAGEFAILNPRIVVTQGDRAKDAFLSLRPSECVRFDKFASVVNVSAKSHFWLHTYHPSNYGAFYRQRSFDRTTGVATGWARYSELVHEFITAPRAEAAS